MEVDFSDRHEYIGASEAATVLGLNPYVTPYDLWLRKTTGGDIESNLPMRFGSFAEAFVLSEYELATGSTVVDRQLEFTSIGRYVRAHIDGRVEGMDKLVEAKTVGEWPYRSWSDSIPTWYRVQVEVQAYLAGAEEVDVAILVGGHSFKIETVKTDADIGKDIVTKCQDWYCEHVLTNEAPAPSTDELIKASVAVGDTDIVASRDVYSDVIEMQRVASEKKRLAEAEAEVKKRIQFYMAEHSTLRDITTLSNGI